MFGVSAPASSVISPTAVRIAPLPADLRMAPCLPRFHGQRFQPGIEIVSRDYRVPPDFSRRDVSLMDFFEQEGSADSSGFRCLLNRHCTFEVLHVSSSTVRQNKSGSWRTWR